MIPIDPQRRVAASPPLSPCVRVCRVDAASGHCVGCKRTLAEITAWFGLRDDAKRAILADLQYRGPAGDVLPPHPV
jgi:uncharacterized protein